MQKAEYNRSKKILALAGVFFFSGLLFFYFRGGEGVSSQPKYQISTNTREEKKPILKDMPPPEDFKVFSFDGQEYLEVSLNCKEEYSTVLIYEKGVDYRYDPLGAKFNTAFVCRKEGNFTQRVSLINVNLIKGAQYYIVRADQPNDGSWHDPY